MPLPKHVPLGNTIIWRLVFMTSACLAYVSPTLAADGDVSRHFFKIADLIDQEYPSLRDLYLHLHSHPELSFHEEKTSQRLASELGQLGFQVTQRVGGFGVVGVFQNGNGPTVMMRTDMDALPVSEETGVPYASQVKTTDDNGNEVYVMHACGHDVHMTVWTGTARLLVEMKGQWKGTLIAIAQPAEERGAGAKAMLGDGLYRRFPRPDYALALHCDAGLPAGQIGYREGFAMANVDSVDITVRGYGGHGAYPHRTKDPVVIAAQIVVALQTIVSREVPPVEPAVITVGSIHGGTKHNIIPNEVKLQLTVRSYADSVRDLLLTSIDRVCQGVAQAAGVPDELCPIVEVLEEFTPSTYNAPELVDRTTMVMRRLLGDQHVVRLEQKTWGEDFGRYGRVEPRVPIFMFTLGTVPRSAYLASQKPGARPLPSLHSSLFAPDYEPTIKTGVKAMTASVLELLD